MSEITAAGPKRCICIHTFNMLHLPSCCLTASVHDHHGYTADIGAEPQQPAVSGQPGHVRIPDVAEPQPQSHRIVERSARSACVAGTPRTCTPVPLMFVVRDLVPKGFITWSEPEDSNTREKRSYGLLHGTPVVVVCRCTRTCGCWRCSGTACAAQTALSSCLSCAPWTWGSTS